MNFKRKYFPYTSVLLTLVFVLNSTEALQFSGDDNEHEVEKGIQNYFPQENNLFLVLVETEKTEFLPLFHVPVVVFTQDQVLRDCGGTWLNWTASS